MDFGLHHLVTCPEGKTPTQCYREAIEQAVHGEELGFESVWPVEHHFNRAVSVMPSPMLLLAAIAERTTRLRLGTAVVQLPLAHPLRVAEDLATLDVLSGGRAELGVSRGGNPAHFAGFGVTALESRERFAEGLEIVQRALRDDRCSFDGKYHQVRDLTLSPQPIQRPHPPIRIAANGVESASWAGRAGFPLLLASNVNPLPKLPPLLAAYHAGRAEAGFAAAAPDDVTLLMPVYIAESREQARREFEPSVRNQAQLAANLAGAALANASEAERAALAPLLDRMRNMSFDDVAAAMGAVGTADDCIARLEQVQRDFGVGRVITWFNFGGLVPHRTVLQNMLRFADDVMPHFARTRPVRAA